MAVRFAADGRDYHRVVNLGTVTQFSITCWMKISVDRNTFSTAWCLDNGTTSDCYLLQADSTGTALFTFSGVTPQTLNGGDLTVGDWYFVGVSVSGGAPPSCESSTRAHSQPPHGRVSTPAPTW